MLKSKANDTTVIGVSSKIVLPGGIFEYSLIRWEIYQLDHTVKFMRDMNDMKQTQKPAILSEVGSVASQGLICRWK